jgi:hypothetical protein
MEHNNNKVNKNNIGQNIKKTKTNKINPRINQMISKKAEVNNLAILNDAKKKQKQIKQCFIDLIKTKEKNVKKENNKISSNIRKDEEKQKPTNINNDLHKTELKPNKYEYDNGNIKVNKIKIEKIDLDNINNVNSVTNRDFYQKSYGINKKFNFLSDLNVANNNNGYNTKRGNIISVKSFNRSLFNKDLLYGQIKNSEYINYISPFNKDNNSICLSNDSKNNKSSKNYLKYNISSNTFSNTTTGKSKLSNSSKLLLSFKNTKTFYAHLEIFISLFLKRIFKIFLQKMKIYVKAKKAYDDIDGIKGNTHRPIVNVNNAHCSLFCSINLNEDKLFNTIFDAKNINAFANYGLTPLTRRAEVIHNRDFVKEEMINNDKRNKIIYINPQLELNLNTNTRLDSLNNKTVYIPKKKLNKNNTDFINSNTNNNYTNINTCENLMNDKINNMKTSPIKEMNINLKKINVCRLNELNQLYLNTLYKSNSGNLNIPGINHPIIKINRNNNNNNNNNNIATTNRPKYNSNNIITIDNISDNNNTTNKNKMKLKKIQSAKSGIYVKPKEKNIGKIKEIKIPNKISPLKNEIDYNKKFNIKTDADIFDDYNKEKLLINEKSKKKDLFLYTIGNERDDNAIKKIYINRCSQQKTPKNINNNNIKDNLFDSYKKKFYSTYLNFNKKNLNNINNEILVKQIKTSDKRLFVSIKYFILINKNYKKNKQKFNFLKINRQDYISIINNKLITKKEFDENTSITNLNNYDFKILDIFSFDNDKKCKNKSKNISFPFKAYLPSKEESIEINNLNIYLITFIKCLKLIIVKNIRKDIFKKLKKMIYLNKIINIKNNKIIYYYFSIYKNKIKDQCSKIDKNNCGIYHKINYNDDYNINKKLKTPKHIQKHDNSSKNKIFNLNLNVHNSSNSKNKVIDKKRNNQISAKINKKTKKYINKEINIIVHNNNNNNNNNNNYNSNKNIALNKLKNKFYLMRIKLIKHTLKMIKNAL